MREELQIQVKNNDKNGVVYMWSEEKFEDKLIMMRDALNEFENKNAMRQSLVQEVQEKEIMD